MTRESESLTRGSKARLIVLWIGIIVGVLILSARLFYWQVIRYEYLQKEKEELLVPPETIPALRGTIMDRHGFVLATDTYEFQVFATPRDIDESEGLATKLAPILGMDQNELAGLLSEQDALYIPLASSLPLEAATAVQVVMQEWVDEGLRIGGLGMSYSRQREYPDNELASHLVGFVRQDDQACYGVEEFYDQDLRGTDGSWGSPADVLGLRIGTGPGGLKLPTDGRDVILTLDRTIQQIAGEELLRGISEYGAQKGTVVVMDPRSGAVLASVSYPGYDPNRFFVEAADEGAPFTDPVVSETYEPGSVFKVVTMAAALDAGIVDRYSTYNDLGQIVVGPAVIQNWDKKAYGVTDMTDLLRYSLNVGAATLSTRMGGATFYDYVQRFGFGQVTGIDVALESPGALRMPGDAQWGEADLGTNAFGQGIAVTPLQMTRAVAAVANDGQLPNPYVVQRIEQGGEVIKEFEPQPAPQIISASVARELTEMLVDSLSGKENVNIPGYAIAGKSGTAQVPHYGGYHPEDTIASFVGYAPADDPRFVILVKVDRPRESPWGSVVAAPVFRRIAERLFAYLSIPPDEVRMASR